MACARRLMVPLALAGAATAPSVRADPNRTSSLSWVALPGAESCAGAGILARAVEGRLGRHALVSPAEADTSIEARADHANGPTRWHAVIELRDHTGTLLGTRELESEAPDCGPLRDAVALAMALMIDPEAVLRAGGPPAATIPPVAPPAPGPRGVVQPIESRAPTPTALPQAWRVDPSVAATLAYGALPSLASGFLLGLTVSPPRFWDVEAFGAVLGSQRLFVQSGASIRFATAYGGVTLCPLRLETGGHAVIDLCAGAQFGVLETTSSGFATSIPQRRPTLEAIGTAHLRVPVAGGLGLRLGGGFGVAFLRDQFVTHGATSAVVFDSPLTTETADVGLALSLP